MLYRRTQIGDSDMLQCNSRASSVAAVEKLLSEQYQQLLKAHSEEVDRWQTAKFSQLHSPTEEANFDLDRFMAKYFLDCVHGQPSPGKTKESLVLGYLDGSAFEKAVRAVPGLATHITDQLTVVGWEATLQRGVDEAFITLPSSNTAGYVPTAEANFDLSRFLAKYFLDSLNGKPAPEKTPNPITLYRLFKDEYRLQTAVASIPGLHLCRADGIYETRTIIGWDTDKVQLKKLEIEEEKAKREAEVAAEALAEREDRWRQALQPHREYMKNLQVTAGPLSLDNLTGSYIVQCEMAEEYCDEGTVMTLDIVQPINAYGTTAAFDFGFVEGTLLLALSDDALHLLKQDQEVDSYSDDSEFDGYASSRKRKAEGTQRAEGPTKRRLGESPKPNRLYLQWAGRETGGGEIQLNTDNMHTGYLDFGASKASAQGVFGYPSLFGSESPISLAIYKTTDRPFKVPSRWTRFSKSLWY